MKKVLITGATKGIGLATAKQLLQQEYYVYLGSRDLKNGTEVGLQLKNEGFENFEVVELDITSQASVDAARITIGKSTDTLDVLINNAGISGGDSQNATTYSVDALKDVFETNFYGAVRVTQAFIDLLKTSTEPRITNLSTVVSSQTLASDLTNPLKVVGYQTSKSALNMYTINLAYELRDTNFKVNCVCPGYVNTGINNFTGPGTVEDAAKKVIKVATLGNDGPTGKFFCEETFKDDYCPW